MKLMTTLKILSRKEANRKALDIGGAQTLVLCLEDPISTAYAAETSNVVLNMCYEPANVANLVERGVLRCLKAFLKRVNIITFF